LSVSWTPVHKYIDGTEIADISDIKYLFYILHNTGSCSSGLSSVNPGNIVQEYTQTENEIDISKYGIGDYCLSVSANKTSNEAYPYTFLYSFNIESP
jgi:hypothetical protein